MDFVFNIINHSVQTGLNSIDITGNHGQMGNINGENVTVLAEQLLNNCFVTQHSISNLDRIVQSQQADKVNAVLILSLTHPFNQIVTLMQVMLSKLDRISKSTLRFK